MTANSDAPDQDRRLREIERALYNLQRERSLPGSPLDNCPTGMVAGFLSSNPPQGWIMLDGSSVTAAAYPSLYAYLTSNGFSTTLPDYRDRFPVGAGNLYTHTSTGGSADANVVSHTHTIDANTTVAEAAGMGLTVQTAFADRVLVSGTASDMATASSGATGTNANLPPYRGLYWMIRT